MSKYTELITSAHNQKPKFMAMVEAVTGAFSGASSIVKSLPGKFDVDVAVGDQLDIVGLWVGISRFVSIEISDYFSIDVSGLGLDEGWLQGRYDPSAGTTRLGDEEYRMVIKTKIGVNHWDGTMASLHEILQGIFEPYGVAVYTIDNQDMTIGYVIQGATLPNPILAMLEGAVVSIKPSGVDISEYDTITAFTDRDFFIDSNLFGD